MISLAMMIVGGSHVPVAAEKEDAPTTFHPCDARDRLDCRSRHRPLLNMTLCHDKCQVEDCKTYLTSVGICFSSGSLFPKDPSWSGLDVFDEITNATLHRTIFSTDNDTCGGDESGRDSFYIPLGVCVGPFGAPRPWGTFEVVAQTGPATTMET
jgi:hypothetical protein